MLALVNPKMSISIEGTHTHPTSHTSVSQHKLIKSKESDLSSSTPGDCKSMFLHWKL